MLRSNNGSSRGSATFEPIKSDPRVSSSGVEIGTDIHEQIQIDRADYEERLGTDIPLFREYSEGRHKRESSLTEGQQMILEGLLENIFCDNMCHRIIAEAVNRLILLRFDVQEGEGQERVQGFLNNWFVTAALDDISGETHYDTLRDGNFALSVAWDNETQKVVVYREPWWDGDTGVFVAYDALGKPLYATKEWYSIKGKRRVVWFDDRLERYLAEQGAASFSSLWQPYVLPDDDEGWPIDWTKTNGAPLHIPVIHFPNSGRGSLNYGWSELAGGVLAFQDQLNDLQYAMSACGRLTGYQMYYLFGVKLKSNAATGEPEQPEIGPGAFFYSENPNAKAGVLGAGSIGELLNLYMTKKASLAHMTSTPQHLLIGGQFPTGEALIRAEEPAIAKAERQIKKFRGRWATVAHRAIEIANAYDPEYRTNPMDENLLIQAVFDAPDRRDMLTKSVVVRNAQGILSQRESLRALGYSPQEVEKIFQECVEERQLMGEQAAELSGKATLAQTAASMALGIPPKQPPVEGAAGAPDTGPSPGKETPAPSTTDLSNLRSSEGTTTESTGINTAG